MKILLTILFIAILGIVSYIKYSNFINYNNNDLKKSIDYTFYVFERELPATVCKDP